MKSAIFAGSALAACALAAPHPKRQSTAVTDADILNYALTLEHLENTFYMQGLANYTAADFAAAGYNETTYHNIQVVSSDESTHVAFLTAALKAAGAPAVAACTYDFGVTGVTSFLQTAAIFEGVGVTAYLGAAADIMSKSYLTDAGSILTVEARHSSYLRSTLSQIPFPTPFDVPLDLDEVYSLVAPFITSCPDSNPTLPVKAFPRLVLSPTAPANITTGTEITLLTPGSIITTASSSDKVYGAFITVTGPVFTPATPVSGGYKLTVPSTAAGDAPINGQSYVVLTGCNKAVTDETIAAGPAIVEISNYEA